MRAEEKNMEERSSGYTGCAEFLADERAASGNTERFPRRSICYHFMYRLFSDVYWRVFLSECTEYGSDRIQLHAIENIEWIVRSYISTGKEERYGGRFFGKCIDQNYKNGIGHLSDCTVFPDSTDRRDLRNRMCDLGRRGIWILLPDGDEEFRRCDRGSVWIFPAGM